MPKITDDRCPEPEGMEPVPGTRMIAHTVMLRESGHCPWCGKGK
jgi:hypothetical protein